MFNYDKNKKIDAINSDIFNFKNVVTSIGYSIRTSTLPRESSMKSVEKRNPELALKIKRYYENINDMKRDLLADVKSGIEKMKLEIKDIEEEKKKEPATPSISSQTFFVILDDKIAPVKEDRNHVSVLESKDMVKFDILSMLGGSSLIKGVEYGYTIHAKNEKYTTNVFCHDLKFPFVRHVEPDFKIMRIDVADGLPKTRLSTNYYREDGVKLLPVVLFEYKSLDKDAETIRRLFVDVSQSEGIVSDRTEDDVLRKKTLKLGNRDNWPWGMNMTKLKEGIYYIEKLRKDDFLAEALVKASTERGCDVKRR